jgi:hypothetical protein
MISPDLAHRGEQLIAAWNTVATKKLDQRLDELVASFDPDGHEQLVPDGRKLGGVKFVVRDGEQ